MRFPLDLEGPSLEYVWSELTVDVEESELLRLRFARDARGDGRAAVGPVAG